MNACRARGCGSRLSSREGRGIGFALTLLFALGLVVLPALHETACEPPCRSSRAETPATPPLECAERGACREGGGGCRADSGADSEAGSDSESESHDPHRCPLCRLARAPIVVAVAAPAPAPASAQGEPPRSLETHSPAPRAAYFLPFPCGPPC